MTNEQIVRRCRNCGGTRKEHHARKPWRCPTRLAESYWCPWTVEDYEAAAKAGREAAARKTTLRVVEVTGQEGAEAEARLLKGLLILLGDADPEKKG